jgi:UDP-glucose-4-epimerase GalE
LSTVLVTGGAGYIGSHAVKALVLAGHQVVIYDNFSEGYPGAVAAIKRAIDRRGRPASAVELIEGDIRDTARLAGALEECRADAVVHLAGFLVVGASVRDPIGYYDNNVRGSLAVLQAMVSASIPVKKLIFSSTCAVFGEPAEVPIREDMPKAPINAYGETKLAVERALPHYERAYGIKAVTLRYFNVAGADPEGDLGEAHAPEVHLIPRAIDAALGRDSLTVFGTDYPTPDGTCQRDYIHVTDLAGAHIKALDHLDRGGPSDAFNLGNGRPFTVLEIIRAVEEVSGRPVPWTAGPRREGDPAVLFTSSERAHRVLGWKPELEDLREIVDSAYQWRVAHPKGYGD